jgi:hypothetical protein
MDQPSTSKKRKYDDHRPLSEKELQQYAEDFIDEEDLFDYSDHSESDHLSFTDHDTDTEDSAGSPYESDEDVPLAQLRYFTGKDGTKWYKTPPPHSRTKAHNIFTNKPGPKGAAKNAKTIIDTWRLMITDDILELIVKYTNIYIQTQKEKFSRERDATETNVAEIKAVIGLLYYSGFMRSCKLNSKDMWANDGSGSNVCIATMSRKRFLFLLKCLRFDDVFTRNERRTIDKLAPIREITEIFKSNVINSYTIGVFATIDEKLEPFRGRCNFRQYIKSKPAKYGIKIFLLADARKFYTLNFEIYCGQQPEGPFRINNDAASIVLRLITPIDKTGSNITMDSWFTSIPLAENLLLNHKITCVGTIRKNKKQIPAEFTTAKKSAEKCSSIFGFSTHSTLVSYTPKPGKIVILLSTLHNDSKIDESSGDKRKPEIITFYNHTKSGVDTVDELCGTYSVSRKSRRWPLTIFFGLLNIAGINGYVIYKDNNPEQMFRRNYLKQLGLQLITEHLEARTKLQSLPVNVKTRIKLILAEGNIKLAKPERPLRTVGRCEDCGNKKDRKTSTSCSLCNKLICRDHTTQICNECVSINFNNENDV